MTLIGDLRVVDAVLIGMLLSASGLWVLHGVRPTASLKRVGLLASSLPIALFLAGPVILGNPGAWGVMSLGAGLLGLQGLRLFRLGAERWVMPGALMLGLGLRLAELLRGSTPITGLGSLLMLLPWAFGLAELLLGGLLVMEERFPFPGRWLDLKGELVAALRRAFAAVALALLLHVLRAEVLDLALGSSGGFLLLGIGALLHLHRLKAWPRGILLAGVILVALLGFAAAVLLSSFPSATQGVMA